MHGISPGLTSVTVLNIRSTTSVKKIFSDVNKYVSINTDKKIDMIVFINFKEKRSKNGRNRPVWNFH
jgi:hypothetical protein